MDLALTTGIAVSYVQHVLMLLALTAGIWVRVPSRLRIAAMLAGLVLATVCAWVTRGWFGELSFTNSAWAALALLGVFAPSRRTHGSIPLAIAMGFVVLTTPMFAGALWLSAWDLYGFGYASVSGLAALALALLAWASGLRLWAGIILTAVALWSLGIRHSPNLWDMLIDAPTWAALCVVCVTSAARLVKRIQTRSNQK